MNKDDKTSISKPISQPVNGNKNMSGSGIAKETSHIKCNEEPSIKSAQDDIDKSASSIANGTTNKEEYPTINNSLSIQQNHFEPLSSASANEKDTVSKSMDINDKKKPSIPHGFGINNNSTSSKQGDRDKRLNVFWEKMCFETREPKHSGLKMDGLCVLISQQLHV